MSTRSNVVSDTDIIVKPTYDSTSRMNNYDIVYNSDKKALECAFYTNSLKDISASYDQTYVVEIEYEHRLDLISYKFYGTAKYDWAIADANNIEDPIEDITVGTVLRIPSQNII